MGVARARDRAAAADLRIHLVTDATVDRQVHVEGDLVVRSKADLGAGDISAVTGEGVDGLLEKVREMLAARVAGAGLVSRARQVEALQDAADALAVTHHAPPELLAEAVRLAALRLHEVIGRVAPDDYLDEIFSTFCIGK